MDMCPWGGAKKMPLHSSPKVMKLAVVGLCHSKGCWEQTSPSWRSSKKGGACVVSCPPSNIAIAAAVVLAIAVLWCDQGTDGRYQGRGGSEATTKFGIRKIAIQSLAPSSISFSREETYFDLLGG